MRASVATISIGAFLLALLAPSASAQLTVCPPGEGQYPEFNVCAPCQLDAYSLGGTGVCQPCGRGSEANDARTACVSCPANFRGGSLMYSDNGDPSVCRPCNGAQVALSGSDTCYDPCQPGQGLFGYGCAACYADFYSPGGDAECTACPSGQTSPAGSSSVDDCRAAVDTTPVSCNPGAGHKDLPYICVNCDPGTFSAGGLDATCASCDVGQTANGDQSGCVDCAAGTFGGGSEGLCTACPASTSSNPGAPSSEYCRTSCPPGEADEFADGSCVACFALGVSPGGISGCSPCPAGQSPADGVTCQVCSPGTYRTDSMRYCEPCGPGFTSGAGAAFCTLDSCPPGTGQGTVADDYNTPGCVPCGPGLVGLGGSGSPSCDACPAGQIPNSDGTACVSCGPNTYGTADGTCEPCGSGLISPAGSITADACTACTEYGEAPVDGQNTCAPCAAGSYVDDNSVCAVCPTGSTSLAGSVGSSSCVTDCPPGQADEFLNGQCNECLFFGVSLGHGAPCLPCQEGEEPSGGTICTACRTGTYKTSDMNYCEPCGQGFTSTTGATSCDFVGCDVGYGIGFSGGFDTQSCVPCEGGTAVRFESGRPYCGVCEVGTVPSPDADTCISCPENTYGSGDESSSTCVPCGDGTTSSPGSVGADSCVDPVCLPPSLPSTGGGCECPRGTFPSFAVVCDTCPAGSTLNSAFTGCDYCQPGTFGEYLEPAVIGGETVLLAVCTPCPLGKTSLEGSVGEDSCTLAPTQNMGRRAALARVGACDRGLTACLLTEETWECVDVNNDIQSCGGCWSDGSGEDCTLLLREDGEGEVSCVKGVCQVAN